MAHQDCVAPLMEMLGYQDRAEVKILNESEELKGKTLDENIYLPFGFNKLSFYEKLRSTNMYFNATATPELHPYYDPSHLHIYVGKKEYASIAAKAKREMEKDEKATVKAQAKLQAMATKELLRISKNKEKGI